MKRKLFLVTTLISLLAAVLAACNSEAAELRPVEEEQIENVVKEFVVRDTDVPDYDVTIEEVANNWARVSITLQNTENSRSMLYLQKQVGEDLAPTAVIAEKPGHEGRASGTTGWAVVLGPRASFSPDKLDELGVPNEVRP